MSSYQVLYRAWRPAVFEDMVGQEPIVQTLRRQVIGGRIAHAYLFCGTRGTGKTTASKILARAVNCLSPRNGDPCGECEMCRAILSESCMDVQEIDAASNNGVDEMRDLREKIQFPPTLTRYKVYIIDEVHMLSTGAFNALLKTLEEPPEHAVFILATTEPQKLPATILSRCQRFDFHRIQAQAIVSRLHTVLEGIGRAAEEEALTEIARAAEGGMRDALSLLDCCLSYTDGTVTLQLARDVLGTAGRATMFEFADALIDASPAQALTLIGTVMDTGCDPIVFARDVTAHLRALMLSQAIGDVTGLLDLTPEDGAHMREQAGRVGPVTLARLMDLFVHVESECRWLTSPRTVLELATVRACHPEQEAGAGLEERLERMEKQLEHGVTVRARPAEKAPAARPETAPEEKPKAAAESAAPDAVPPEYLAAMEAFGADQPAVRPMLNKVFFSRMEGDTVFIRGTKAQMLALRMVEKRLSILSEKLTEAYGRPITAALERAEAPAAVPEAGKLNAQSRPIVEKALDIFDRDKISFTD